MPGFGALGLAPQGPMRSISGPKVNSQLSPSPSGSPQAPDQRHFTHSTALSADPPMKPRMPSLGKRPA